MTRRRFAATLAATALSRAAAPAPFRVAKKDGRWFLIRPDGRHHLLFGINHLAQARPVEGLADRLLSWGFNAAGYGSGALERELPHFAATTLADLPFFAVQAGERKPGRSYRFPDVFSDEWQREAVEKQRAAAVRHRDNPNLLGYVWSDVVTWDIHLTRALRGADWVSAIRAMEAPAPGKRRYAAFLRGRYAGRDGELMELYGAAPAALEADRFSSVALGHPAVMRDDRAFLGLIAAEYYRAAATQRGHDPARLVFGDRYLVDDCPDEVIAAAAPHIDVVSVQTGDGPTPLHMRSDVFQKAALDRLYRLTGKPILICDHQISFPTAEHPRASWTQLGSVQEAAAATREYIRAAFDTGYVIGYVRCQYVDQAPAMLGRGVKRGLVDQRGRPYTEMVEAHRTAFNEVRRRYRLA